MRLINLTQKVALTNNLIIANTIIRSSIGLLNQPPETAMLFKTRWGIHTFGMKHPLDIIVLNNNMKIVKIKKNLKPNRLFFWNPFYCLIIEIPPNQKTIIKINDILKIDT
jgi:uncharacterized membrane protein (UPF0127 family)